MTNPNTYELHSDTLRDSPSCSQGEGVREHKSTAELLKEGQCDLLCIISMLWLHPLLQFLPNVFHELLHVQIRSTLPASWGGGSWDPAFLSLPWTDPHSELSIWHHPSFFFLRLCLQMTWLFIWKIRSNWQKKKREKRLLELVKIKPNIYKIYIRKIIKFWWIKSKN